MVAAGGGEGQEQPKKTLLGKKLGHNLDERIAAGNEQKTQGLGPPGRVQQALRYVEGCYGGGARRRPAVLPSHTPGGTF